MTSTPPSAYASRPAMDVAVLMRRERVTGPAARWADWRWTLDAVIADEPGFGSAARLLRRDDAGGEIWLYPGHRVELFRDDAEGYYLNASTDTPGWWVMWRMEEGGDPRPQPQIVTLSYHDAGRWLDAQETVEQVPAAPDVVAWLRAFVEQHYQPEVKRRARPQSFRGLQDRFGNPVSISTEKRRGGGGGV